MQAQETEFTYQGELNQNSNPACGTINLAFTLYDGPNFILGVPVGSPEPLNNVAVVNGRFTVELNLPITSFDNADRLTIPENQTQSVCHPNPQHVVARQS